MTSRRASAIAAVLLAAWAATQAGAAAGVAPADAVPPLRLADTGLYDASGLVDPRNRAFAPQYPLWTDGMTKRRWAFVPAGSAIDASDEHQWRFPAGTRFWKEFSLRGRKVETRLLWKVSAEQWIAASYAWNEDGTGAVLAPADGFLRAAEVVPGRWHSIPARADCLACHGARTRPLGFNALQLSPDRDPHAIHGEPLQPGMTALPDLVSAGVLVNLRRDLAANPPRIATADPATRAVLGYLAANCGACHDGSGEISALGPVLRLRDLVENGDAVARSFIARPTRWQLPGVPDGASVLVHPGAPQLSALAARMRSRSPSTQMPPLGTAVRDEQAVQAIDRWIHSLAARP